MGSEFVKTGTTPQKYQKVVAELQDSDENELAKGTAYPMISGNHVYCNLKDEWIRDQVGCSGIHLCATDIAVTTGFVLIDLTDTTNYPHNGGDNIWITGYQVSINPDDSFVGQVLFGFIEDIDENNAHFQPLICYKLEKKSSNIIDSLSLNNGAQKASSDSFLVVGNAADATFQNDTGLVSPSGTSIPGNGDVVMKIVRTAGEVNVGITLRYFTK